MSARLKARILDRIASEGPLSFAEFMTAALYDPEEGFFANSPTSDHFVTSPHISPLFGALLTTQLREVWRVLGEPDEFPVVELGAGDGTLAAQVIEAAKEDDGFARALHYIVVDRSERARKQLGERGLETHGTIDELGRIRGCFVANELLDNIPFHLMADGGELKVGSKDGRLVFVHDAFSKAPEVTAARPFSPESLTMVDSIASLLEAGYAFFFDYGFTAEEIPEPVRAYQGHRLVDVLEDPGSRDMTGPVDLDAIAARARTAGLQAWGPVSQRAALMSLGYRGLLDRMRKEQAELEHKKEWTRAVTLFGSRGDAAMLVDPAGLGGLKVLALGTAYLPEPRATRTR